MIIVKEYPFYGRLFLKFDIALCFMVHIGRYVSLCITKSRASVQLIMKPVFTIFILILSICFHAGCNNCIIKNKNPGSYAVPSKANHQAEKNISIRLATTTSCDNSGLLKHILPDFKSKTGIGVDVIAVGTGKALELGKNGDVDVVLVHAPDTEKQYIENGWATNRTYVCQNEFVIVGPESDPAKLSNAKSALDAMRRIQKNKSEFISRSDNSGTHKKELSIWKNAGIEPSGDWYIKAGQGMGAVLIMAYEMDAYTLTDTGTYYAMTSKLNLPIAFSGDSNLENVYSVLKLNPEKHPDLNHSDVKEFIEWLTSDETAKLIRAFEVNEHTLFSVTDHYE